MIMKKVVPFKKARETSLYGSKAVGLGDAARQGLPVPPGVALSGDLVEAIASGEDEFIEKVDKAIAALPSPFAVRSSAVDEDGAAASFAGQHLTLLNVHSAADVAGAVRESGGPRTRTPLPTDKRSACSHDRASASSSRRSSIPPAPGSCLRSIPSPAPMNG